MRIFAWRDNSAWQGGEKKKKKKIGDATAKKQKEKLQFNDTVVRLSLRWVERDRDEGERW
jgi:hypothetical protein